MKTSVLVLPLALGVLGAVVPLAACSSNKNHEERAAAAPPVVPPTCVGSCKPDPLASVPSPREAEPVDQCRRATAGLEFLPVERFEPRGAMAAAEVKDAAPGLAAFFYTYTDRSQGSFFEPRLDANQFNTAVAGSKPPGVAPDPTEIIDLSEEPFYWGLPALGLGGPCGTAAEPNRRSFRIYGGRFLAYGGGFGMSLANFCDPLSGVCPTAEDRPELATIGYWNVSEWDGIAFWARRGPEGMATLNVGLLDAETSDTLAGAFPGGPHCKTLPRLCGCLNDTVCSEMPGDAVLDPATNTFSYETPEGQEPRPPRTYCLVPGAPLPTTGPWPQPCGADACSEGTAGGQWEAPLVPIPETQLECSPHQFTEDKLRNSYCFTPGEDPNPPELSQRCGNAWVRTVQLTEQWQLIVVPFEQLRQSQYGRQSKSFDTSAISTFQFTFGAGWLDVYIDDLSFYRSAR